MRCIFRLFGIQVPTYSSLSLPSILCNILGEQADLDTNMINVEPKVCRICLGILQFTCPGDEAIIVEKESANDFATAIADLAKKEGHEIDSFSLEVSLPPIILENENRVW